MKYTDLIAAADRYALNIPECPDCGDFAHPTSTCCEGCGAHLFPSNNKGPAEHPVEGRAQPAEEVRV